MSILEVLQIQGVDVGSCPGARRRREHDEVVMVDVADQRIAVDNVQFADNAGSSWRTVFQYYCVSVKNLTVTIPDDVYRTARIRAAEAGTSVSAMVAAYLRSLDAEAAEFDRRARLQLEIMSQIRAFSASDRLGRNEVHDRTLG